MIHHPLRRTALAIALSTLGAGVAQAAAGEMTLDLLGSKHTIDLQSLQWGVGVGISPPLGGVDRQASHPSFSDITWTQNIDTTVPMLMTLAVTGKSTPLANFKLVSPASQSGKPYLTLQTSDNFVSGVSTSNASGGGTGSASASLAYDKFSMIYDPAQFGGTGPTVTTTYDLAKQKLTSGPTSRKPAPIQGGATAADGIYLRLGSGTTAIAGDSQAAGYQNWIAIDSSQMGIGVAISSATGSARRAGKPSVSELTITQKFDATVPVVFADLVRGTNIGQATLEYVSGSGSGKPATFMQLVLENVMLSGLSLSTGGDRPSVSESLNFTGFSQTVWDINDDGSRGQSTTACYDLMAGKATCRTATQVAGFGLGNLSPELSGAIGVAEAAGVSLPDGVGLVPEPQAWLMMLAGIGVLAGAARRRVAV